MSEGLSSLAATALPLLALCSIRVAAAFVAMPAPFGDVAPAQVRAFLSMAVSVALFPLYAARGDAVTLSAAALLLAGAGEFLVGAVIGLSVRLTLAAAELAGSIAGFSMGLGFATSVDPAFGEGSLPTTRAVGAFGTLIFFAMQGHHSVIAAFASTLQSAPPGATWGAVSDIGLLSLGGEMVARGLQIAAPVVATMFVVQLGTALVARAAPRVNLFAFSFSIAASVGMLTLFVAAPSLATAISVEVRRIPVVLARLLVGA